MYSEIKRAPARRRRHRRWPRFLFFFLLLAVLAGALLHGIGSPALRRLTQAEIPSWVDVQLVAVNGSGRRGEKLEAIHDIVIHYVGNPGTTAQQNHDFFDQPDTTVSAHFLVGMDGEIIQCIPLDEKSSASNERNRDTISIEVCHPDAAGKFRPASYRALVKLTAWLCDTAGMDRDRVIRHYDITGKRCPLYFVEHQDAWVQFLTDVKNA